MDGYGFRSRTILAQSHMNLVEYFVYDSFPTPHHCEREAVTPTLDNPNASDDRTSTCWCLESIDNFSSAGHGDLDTVGAPSPETLPQ
jgi:hypothetical protein